MLKCLPMIHHFFQLLVTPINQATNLIPISLKLTIGLFSGKCHLKGKFTHFQYFDMLQSLRNKNQQKKPQVKSFICSRDIDVQSWTYSAFCNENV